MCDGSLRRLRLDEIPLYQLHRPDPKVPYEDSVGALVELKEQGKIRHIGLSNVDEAQLRHRAVADAGRVGAEPLQPRDRDSESMLDLCEQEGIAFLPWAPIQDTDATVAVAEVAARHGVTHHAGRARVAAGAVAGDAADPGHGLGRAPRGERRARRASSSPPTRSPRSPALLDRVRTATSAFWPPLEHLHRP